MKWQKPSPLKQCNKFLREKLIFEFHLPSLAIQVREKEKKMVMEKNCKTS